jgi:hypothetical protein
MPTSLRSLYRGRGFERDHELSTIPRFYEPGPVLMSDVLRAYREPAPRKYEACVNHQGWLPLSGSRHHDPLSAPNGLSAAERSLAGIQHMARDGALLRGVIAESYLQDVSLEEIEVSWGRE